MNTMTRNAQATSIINDFDDGRTTPIPGLPQTWEEALSELEEGEREFERGDTYSHEEVMKMIRDTIENYAG